MTHPPHDPTVALARPLSPHESDTLHTHARHRSRRSTDGPPVPGALTASDLEGAGRVATWLRKHIAIVVAALLAWGGGYKARPDYMLPALGLAAPPVPVDTALMLRVAAVERAASLSIEDRRDIRAESSLRWALIARSLCAIQTPDQRQVGGLPCASLLNGGLWDMAPGGRP